MQSTVIFSPTYDSLKVNSLTVNFSGDNSIVGCYIGWIEHMVSME